MWRNVNMDSLLPRKQAVHYISPEKQVNAGLWTLFAGATVFLGARIWCKITRRTGLWYDDYMLVASWLVLMITNIFISVEFATGYATGNWDDRMHILINISSCGTLIDTALSKTALGITLLRMSNRTQAIILWFCILSMNLFMIIKVFFQWAKYCGRDDYQNWYRLQGPCINYNFEESFKVIGNTDNIVMDFIFACFPWWITWNLEMRRVEKIALCMTMSLGMFVAIISAIRTRWKDRAIMHTHDEYYIWRNGMSNIWYSAEVVGTIIVQCIPILRPFLRDVHNTMTNSKLRDLDLETEGGDRGSFRSSLRKSISRGNGHGARDSGVDGKGDGKGNGEGDLNIEVIALDVFSEEGKRISMGEGNHLPPRTLSSFLMSPSPTMEHMPISFNTTAPLGLSPRTHGTWFFDSDQDVEYRRSEMTSPRSDIWDHEDHEEMEQDERKRGLRPPPRPKAR